MKQGDALLTPLFNFALKYAIRKVRETYLRWDMNGIHQELAYADDVKTKERNGEVLSQYQNRKKLKYVNKCL